MPRAFHVIAASASIREVSCMLRSVRTGFKSLRALPSQTLRPQHNHQQLFKNLPSHFSSSSSANPPLLPTPVADWDSVAVLRHPFHPGAGAFATRDIEAGEVIEHGVMRLLPKDYPSKQCPYVFTWNDEIPATQFAHPSGAVMSYNSVPENPNTEMVRDFDNDVFHVVANRKLYRGQELYHTYKSANWRKVFVNCDYIQKSEACLTPHPIFDDNDNDGSHLLQQILVHTENVMVCADRYGGHGAFARKPIKKGDLVERGIIRRCPIGLNGGAYPYVFTWHQPPSDLALYNPREHAWGMGSGASMFYNTVQNGQEANTHMQRNFDDDVFEIRANKDIEEGEELLHRYKGQGIRSCFVNDQAINPTMD